MSTAICGSDLHPYKGSMPLRDGRWNGGTVSVIGVYGECIDKFPTGSPMNRSLTLRTGQCHVQRYMRPLLST